MKTFYSQREPNKVWYSRREPNKVWYKITNKTEKHNGLKYRKGLVVDPKPFNPSGNCQPGGIYFTNVKNILAFCWVGTNLRKVFLPEDAQVYKNPGKPKKWKADKVIIGKKFPLWTRETFEKLISEGADVHACSDFALQWASENGHLEVVKVLLESGADVHAGDDGALRWASENGHKEIVKILKGAMK